MAMQHWLKISHHKHSGRLRPHEATSYLPLAVLLLLVGFALTICSVSALSPGPQAGSVGLKGTMPGAPPKIAATINTPHSGQHFTTTPVTVSGSCLANTLVEIYKNDIFAGSGSCSARGAYSIDIDLLIGQNTLVARVYDDLNQPGPDSNQVTVFYDALPTQASALAGLNFNSAQLLLTTDAVYRGLFPNQQFSVPVQVLGGTPPYAVDIEWGDNSHKVTPRNDNITFTVQHTYTKAGVFPIKMQATDAFGRVAFLSVAAIVNGQPGAAAPTISNKKPPYSAVLVMWPLYTGMIACVGSFWLGERREKHALSPHYA